MKVKFMILSTASLVGLAVLAKNILITKEAQKSFVQAVSKSGRALDAILVDYAGSRGPKGAKNILLHQTKVEKEWLEAIQ